MVDLRSKNTKLNKTFMLTLERFLDLWQAALHFNGKNYSITECIKGIPQKGRRLKLRKASEYLQLASETCNLSTELLDVWFRKS